MNGQIEHLLGSKTSLISLNTTEENSEDEEEGTSVSTRKLFFSQKDDPRVSRLFVYSGQALTKSVTAPIKVKQNYALLKKQKSLNARALYEVQTSPSIR